MRELLRTWNTSIVGQPTVLDRDEADVRMARIFGAIASNGVLDVFFATIISAVSVIMAQSMLENMASVSSSACAEEMTLAIFSRVARILRRSLDLARTGTFIA